MRPVYQSPLSGRRDPSLFAIWLQWARDLGLTFTPYRDIEEKKPYTGWRDPFKRPRRYPLDDKKYGMDPKTGTIWRRPGT